MSLQGPVASVFWLDDALESRLRLDSIVTLVDAKNFARQLRRVPEDGGGDGDGDGDGDGSVGDKEFTVRPKNEAAMQVAYADRVLINKVCERVQFWVRSIVTGVEILLDSQVTRESLHERVSTLLLQYVSLNTPACRAPLLRNNRACCTTCDGQDPRSFSCGLNTLL